MPYENFDSSDDVNNHPQERNKTKHKSNSDNSNDYFLCNVSIFIALSSLTSASDENNNVNLLTLLSNK